MVGVIVGDVAVDVVVVGGGGGGVRCGGGVVDVVDGDGGVVVGVGAVGMGVGALMLVAVVVLSGVLPWLVCSWVGVGDCVDVYGDGWWILVMMMWVCGGVHRCRCCEWCCCG